MTCSSPAPRHSVLFLLGPLASLFLAGCITQPPVDPTIHMLTPGETELGVSTDYGVIFLGRGQQSGSVDFDAWFGDGPSREFGIIESVGGGLYVTEAEIQLPGVPLTFERPSPGEGVVVVGRSGPRKWKTTAEIATHPMVSGLLLLMNEDLSFLDVTQVGAGVYVPREGGKLVLLGLVSGSALLPDEQGGMTEYVTVMGPEVMWRVVVHGRNRSRGRRWIYREDIL